MPTPPRIQPIVGDTVHYYSFRDGPLAAIVTAVHPTYVNLFVYAADAMKAYPALGVSYAEGPTVTSGQQFWTWREPSRR